MKISENLIGMILFTILIITTLAQCSSADGFLWLCDFDELILNFMKGQLSHGQHRYIGKHHQRHHRNHRLRIYNLGGNQAQAYQFLDQTLVASERQKGSTTEDLVFRNSMFASVESMPFGIIANHLSYLWPKKLTGHEFAQILPCPAGTGKWLIKAFKFWAFF